MSISRWQLAGYHSSGFGAHVAGEERGKSWCWQPKLQFHKRDTARRGRGEEEKGEGGQQRGRGGCLQPDSSQPGDEELPQCHVITWGCWNALVRQTIWPVHIINFNNLFCSWSANSSGRPSNILSVQIAHCFYLYSRCSSAQPFSFDPDSMANALDRLLGM